MPSKNGVLDLGDLAPQTRPVRIQRDGESVVLKGFVEGKRCPGRVRVAIAAANDQLIESTSAEGASRAEIELAHYENLRDTLLAVVDGLEFEEAEVLANDIDLVTNLFVYLGWREEDADDDSPESVVAESQSTGENSSPSSPPPITSDQTSS